MGFGNMFKKVMQMRGNASGVGQLGKRLMKEGGEVKKVKKDPNPTPQHIADPVIPYNPNDKIGSDIRIDGKKMKATPPPAPASAASSPNKKAKGGCVKMAKGGSASSRADGCATKGKTKGKMV